MELAINYINYTLAQVRMAIQKPTLCSDHQELMKRMLKLICKEFLYTQLQYTLLSVGSDRKELN